MWEKFLITAGMTQKTWYTVLSVLIGVPGLQFLTSLHLVLHISLFAFSFSPASGVLGGILQLLFCSRGWYCRTKENLTVGWECKIISWQSPLPKLQESPYLQCLALELGKDGSDIEEIFSYSISWKCSMVSENFFFGNELWSRESLGTKSCVSPNLSC